MRTLKLSNYSRPVITCVCVCVEVSAGHGGNPLDINIFLFSDGSRTVSHDQRSDFLNPSLGFSNLFYTLFQLNRFFPARVPPPVSPTTMCFPAEPVFPSWQSPISILFFTRRFSSYFVTTPPALSSLVGAEIFRGSFALRYQNIYSFKQSLTFSSSVSAGFGTDEGSGRGRRFQRHIRLPFGLGQCHNDVGKFAVRHQTSQTQFYLAIG